MESSLPESVRQMLLSQLIDDPQLPRANPTEAFWQLPPHKSLSEIRSDTLPKTVDHAIIGSGVTGCSIAKNLLDSKSASDQSVIVFEARALTSGATGRNGGALTSFAPYEFKTITDKLGKDEAIKIAKFADRTLEKMHMLGNSSPEFKEASEVRRLRDVVAFQDEGSFQAAQESFKLYEASIPQAQGTIEILSAQEALEKYNVKDVVGAVVFDCGAFWPYRLITATWSQLYEQNKDRFSIQTRTPITAISYDSEGNPDHPYVLTTPRGTVRARNVIHATNGYTGHLLPNLRGKIYPLRGTMSTQKAGPGFGHYGSERAWSFCHSGKFDSDAGVFETGLYYSNQNPKSNDIFIGGEKIKLNELFVSDDTQISQTSRENLSTVLPKFFDHAWEEGKNPEVRKIWSGIMGFTADHLPLVGKLPRSATDRGEEQQDNQGEWICAGFNGYGMPQCWSSGEAVAKMLLGEDSSDFLPDSYLTTKERLEDEKRMSAEVALSHMLSF